MNHVDKLWSLGGVEELRHELGEGDGALEADRVARPAHNRQPGVGPDGVDRALRKWPELVVECPCHDQDRHLELSEAIPYRCLGAGPYGSQRGGQAAGRVGEARRPVSLLFGQVSEKWSLEPSLDELRHDRVAAPFELGCALFVSDLAEPAIRLVADARVRADDDEALDQVRRLECQMEAAPASERVADVARLSSRLTKSSGGLIEPRAGIGNRRAAVTGEIRCHDFKVAFKLARDARPRHARLGEPVNEHDRRSLAPPRRVEPEWPTAGRLCVLEGHRG